MDIGELHRRSVAGFVSRLDAAGDRWGAPTPCPDWDVRGLVNHVVGEELWTGPLMRGATIEEVGDRFEGDVLGDDPIAVAREAAGTAATAADEGTADDRIVHLSFGDVPASEYAYQLAADHLIHAWDLAAATGGDRRLDPEVVAAVATWFDEREAVYRSARVIGDHPDGDEPIDPQDRLVWRFGRRPGWQPPTGG